MTIEVFKETSFNFNNYFNLEEIKQYCLKFLVCFLHILLKQMSSILNTSNSDGGHESTNQLTLLPTVL